jgi:hypothetical protein
VWDAQIIAASNQGDDTAVVLDSLRLPAVRHIETGDGDPSLGLFEYSAPDGSAPTNVDSLLQANPNAGYRLPLAPLLARARRAEAAGGKQLAGFKTESMCMRVHVLDPAIDPTAWDECSLVDTMDALRDRIACVLDISLAQDHAVLIAAAQMLDGKTRLETVHSWSGKGCTKAVRRELPGLLAKVKPRAFGWFPDGPAASMQADLRDQGKKDPARTWPPTGVVVSELKAETYAICMGFSELVLAHEIAHSDDELINQHTRAAQKLHIKDRWVYARRGTMPINGAYAAAGATHLARTLPAPIGRPRLVMPSS